MAFTLFIGLALLRPVLRYSDDLEGLLGIAPLVATLPREKSVTEPGFRAAVNSLRNAIQLLPGSEHKPPRRAAIIGITGLEEGCGTTDLCRSLAASFAESGLSTLMVDADLLSPDLTARLEANEHSGWRDLLSDSNATAQPIALEEGVALLPTGLAKGVQDTGVSLPRLRGALGQLSQDYDLLLLDLGPFRKRLAASLIASQADLTVVVSRPGEPAPQLRRILGQLDRIAPGALCQVFNFASRRDPEIAALIA